MKNISRRVFIKGMAVAAAATAASTVLAGCKVPTGTTPEEVPTATQSGSLKNVEGDKLTLTATGLSTISYTNTAVISLKTLNEFDGKSAQFVANSGALGNKSTYWNNADYAVRVQAYFDDSKTAVDPDFTVYGGVKNSLFTTAGHGTLIAADTTSDTYNVAGDLYFSNDEDWKKVKVVFTLYKDNGSSQSVIGNQVEFTFNK